jgi:hypothetical protein
VFIDRPPFGVHGLGHPVSVDPLSGEPEPLPDVRRTDARCANIGGPDGISQCFQVKAYIIEPRASVSARNLLSKRDCRTALGDEASKLGPEVSLVRFAFPPPRRAERLAGAGAGPDGPIVWPPSEAQGIGPSSDSCEEVALSEPAEVIISNIDN